MSASTPLQVLGNEELEVELLPFVNDRYGGVIVEITMPMDNEVFASRLRYSIYQWKQEGKKGVWIKLPIQHVNLVESAVKEGFWYHHAEPNYLMLVYWIPECANTLPVNASHRIGIGAFVMNDNREVLVVQEASGRLKGLGIWKFPTGVINEGEDICVAAVREVKEETSIDTEFVEVLGFRQSHKMFFEKSDIFFLCMLRPLSFHVQKQESEIEAVQWMPWEEYVAQPFIKENEFAKCIIEVCLAKKQGNYRGFSPVFLGSSFYERNNVFYLNNKDMEHQKDSRFSR